MPKNLSKILSLWIALGLLAGCGLFPAPAPGNSAQTFSVSASPEPATVTQTAPPVRASATPAASATRAPSATPAPSATATEIPRPARVLILSIDGLRPEAISLAPMPNLLALMSESAYSLKAQAVFPSATLPNHASMLTGQCPAKHGVTWNDYLPLMGYAQGQSLFSVAKQAGRKTIMFVGKEKLRQVTPPESTDLFKYINDRDLVIAAAALPELQKGFDLAFVHFPTADWMGHEYGWLSPEQLSVLRRADEALGNLLAGLREASLLESTLLIISADHGGHNQTHGSRLPEDMTIPWLAYGPGIVAGEISAPVNTTDTAATAAWALGLPLPPEWDGQPLQEAFGFLPQPRLDPRCP
jgi:hypothetical protein